MNRIVSLTIGLSLLATSAHASGFYFGDNGTKALLQGGAFAAQADDITAIQHNPAGLAQQDGWSALVDTEFINHDVTFLRQDPGFDPNNPSNLVKPVKNVGGIFFLPFAGVSKGFRLADHKVSIGLGIYTPPSVGRYAFTEPNYTRDADGKYVESPVKNAAQRYSLISNNVVVAYPTLTLAAELHPKFALGLSIQAVYSGFSFKQVIYSGLFTPSRQIAEQPEFDSVVNVDVVGQWGITGILGALYKPTDSLSFGASFRPPIPIKATGTIDINLGEVPKQLTTVDGNKTMFQMTLPAELRIGARFSPMERWGINADFVYQGWNSIDQIVLTPTNVTTKIGNGEATPVAPLKVVKNWKGSFSGRLGGSFEVIEKYLTVHAGVFYETGSSADEYYTLDFAHPNRVFITGGLSTRVSMFEFIGGIAYSPMVTSNITQSEVRQGQTDPSVPGNVVGTGVYTSGGYTLTFGVRFRYGQEEKKVRPSELIADKAAPVEVKPAATPVEEKPAGAPAPDSAVKEPQ